MRPGALWPLAGLLVAAPAMAQKPARDPIAAEALFDRGKQLVDQGRTHEACDAFAESQRLDPAGGTLLRLALCHEADGKLASAWVEYLEVQRQSSEASGDPAKLGERVRLAREHLAAIGPRVPKLSIVVPAGARVSGLRVTANGLPRGETTWGVALPVDAGDVIVVASAPGRVSSQTTVHATDGQQTNVELTPLAVDAAVPRLSPPGTHASVARPLGVALGIAGLASLGVGAYFGARALSKWSSSNDVCPGTSCPTSAGVTLANDARTSAHVADVTLAVGAAALVAGAILYLVGAPSPALRGSLDGVALTF